MLFGGILNIVSVIIAHPIFNYTNDRMSTKKKVKMWEVK